ncbi:lsu ribosomal protein l21p [hydrocarbon metagenome]|uniref:Lsu ribosomal protein l21p n=1 Tax=hydrocarbon metagenome TaxID=938273 RepID=A0A0W8FZJ0_9ZZZZ
MFAVVNIAGEQFKVSENTKYYVPKLEGNIDTEITFDQILLLSDGKKTEVGVPTIDGKTVHAKILEHLKDDKVIIFKKKRRKGYRRFKGHKQELTRIEVTKIG